MPMLPPCASGLSLRCRWSDCAAGYLLVGIKTKSRAD
jgi:hypothetical protein